MPFNYKKHAKLIAFSILIVPYTIYIFSIIFLLFYRPLYTHAEYWIADALNIKSYNFQQRDKNKNNIFFISGSNGILGIFTLVLEKEFNYNIHNLAITALIPLSFYLNLAKQYAQKGDIIIAPLEYIFHLESDNLTQTHYNQFTTWGVDFQPFLSLKMRRQLFIKNIQTYWKRLPNLLKPLPIRDKNELIKSIVKDNNIFAENTYHSSSLNAHGEFIFDLPPKVLPEFIHKFNTATPSFIDELKKFNAYAKEHGIKFYITFPLTLKKESFNVDTQNTQELINKYTQIFKNLGITFFGTAQFYNLDYKYFFDTEYHLNATGAVLRSLLLAEDINTYVLGKESSYDIQSEKARNEFFQQKESEALEIMKFLRKKNIKVQNTNKITTE